MAVPANVANAAAGPGAVKNKASQDPASEGKPPKKKRRTKQHVQPDATIHPTTSLFTVAGTEGVAAAVQQMHAEQSAEAAAAASSTASTGTSASSASAATDEPKQSDATASNAAAATNGDSAPATGANESASVGVTMSTSPPPGAGTTSPAVGSTGGGGGTPKAVPQTKKQIKLQKQKEKKQKAAAALSAAAAGAPAAASITSAGSPTVSSGAAAAAATAAGAGSGKAVGSAAGGGALATSIPSKTDANSKDAKQDAKDKKGQKRADDKAQDKAKAMHEANNDQLKKKTSGLDAKVINGDTFESENHFYPRVLNSNIHPMVANFLRLGNDRIASRYCHLNPKVKEEGLKKLLAECPKVFRWSGADLFNVTNVNGQRQMIIVETNSCPSGQKSMPLVSEEEMADGYHKLMRTTFLPTVAEMERRGELPKGGLAVIYDKNPMEASGYCAALAALSKEPVMLAEFYETDTDPPVKWIDGVTHIRDEEKKWHPMRACFRYVTQRPWNRIPMESKTLIFNPIVACLAGGRNKMAADKAYELFNHMIAETGLKIRTPETIRDVAKEMVPLWVASMGGHAVVKVPYSNAGQGVYTIVNEEELKSFMESPQRYDKYIVQSLVGNSTWSSITRSGQYFHAGTIPNKKCETFAADLRVMVAGSPLTGFTPVAVYARRAEKPLAHKLDHAEDSWAMLGTNLSVKLPDGGWTTETERLLLMDMKDFNRLGIGTDDLIDAYVQTILATTAIDRLALQLVKNQKFDFMLYRSLNSDESLLREILLGQRNAASSSTAAAAAAAILPPPYYHTNTHGTGTAAAGHSAAGAATAATAHTAAAAGGGGHSHGAAASGGPSTIHH